MVFWIEAFSQLWKGSQKWDWVSNTCDNPSAGVFYAIGLEGDPGDVPITYNRASY
jgi:hypothetical protein